MAVSNLLNEKGDSVYFTINFKDSTPCVVFAVRI
jgi:hypothetical protein